VTDAPAPTPEASPSPKGSPLRRLYDWVLHWAYTPYAMPALILLSFAESSFFPIPPDVLLIPLVLGHREKAWYFAFYCTLASVLGGIAGYFMGMGLWESGLDRICYDYIPGFTEKGFQKVAALYGEYSFWVVFTAGLSPVPYKIITISAGVFHETVPFWIFVIASVVSRAARFYLVTLLLRRFGPPIQRFIEKRLGLMTIAFCVLLVGGFLLIKFALGGGEH